ncbi:MAG: hypothetical protein FJ096_13640, partial [Deltaproteobacteria bacterium]|nr:hypothetical protein [Deltaproteobacteria bacterium]
MTSRKLLASLLLGASVAIAAACDSSVETRGTASASHSTGASSTASSASTSSVTTSSSAGSGGSTGVGGEAGTGSAATSSSSGNVSSSAGGGVVAECTDSKECKLINDCCSCFAMPSAEPGPKCSLPNCFADTCTAQMTPPVEPTCAAGRCTAFDCDHSKVMCKKSQPICGPGETVAVENQCWAGCVPATQCITVASCAQCDSKKQGCVTEAAKGPMRVHCVDLPASCN